MKKIWMPLLLALVLCTTTLSLVSAAQSKTLIHWSRELFQEERKQAVIARAKEFEKLNPDVKVQVEFLPFQESYTKTMAAIAAGNPPEVGEQGPDLVTQFASAQELAPLNDVVRGIGKDKFIPMAKDAWATIKGKVYGIPWYLETRVLFYRKDILEKEGIKPPTTWAEWLTAMKALTKDTDKDGQIDQWGSVVSGNGPGLGQLWMILGATNGGMILNRQGKVVINSKPMKEALQWLVDLKLKHQVMPPAVLQYTQQDVSKMFELGKAPMLIMSGNDILNIKRNRPELASKIGAVKIPINRPGQTSRSFLGGFQLFVFAKSKNPDDAKKFVKYMFAEPFYSNFLKYAEGGALPVLKQVANQPLYKDDPLVKVMMDQLPTAVRYGGPLYGNAPQLGEVEGRLLLTKAVQETLAGQKTVDKAVADLEREIKALFEE